MVILTYFNVNINVNINIHVNVNILIVCDFRDTLTPLQDCICQKDS